MEEVWKDINLSSLHDHLSPRDDPRATTTSHGMTFQDLLAPPFSTKPPISSPYFSQVPQTPHVLGKSSHLKHTPVMQNPTTLQISDRHLPFDPPASSSGLIPNGKKNCPEADQNHSRHKKMIKNRESAARSRARKQAYTDELELELARLLKENANLKKQHQQLCLAVAVQEPKKYKLLRATSAPF